MQLCKTDVKAVLFFIILPLLAQSATAEPLSLQTGLLLNWNRNLTPAASPFLDLPVNNDSPTNANNLTMVGFTFRVKTDRLSGLGTLDIDQSSIDYPLVNSVIPSGNRQPIVPVSSLPAFVAFSGLDTTGTGHPVSDGQNLARLRFTTPDNAIGVFRLFAVNDDSTDGTGWLANNGLAQAYTNSPFTDPSPDLLLATITVTGVPEPGTLSLSALGGLLGIAAYYRRRRRACS